MIAGGMAEWSMAVVLKTARVQALVGSNPTPSASVLSQDIPDACRKTLWTGQRPLRGW